VAADNKQEKLKGNNLYIVLILVSVLVVGAAAIITKTLVGSIATNTKVITAKDAANNQLKSDLSAAPQLVDAYNSLGPQQTTISDALPIYSDLPDLLVTLQNMASNSGVSIKSVSPSNNGAVATPPAPAAAGAGSSAAPQPYGFSISYEGSYASILRLLGQMETSARPMRVVGIQMTGTGGDLTGNLDVDTFYQPAAQMPFSTEAIH
jgi:hypothetical protein